MVPDILTKLDLELKQEITSERQVVYILVQIRKLIDSADLANKFEALKLHCDWVVHTKLDRRPAKELLEKLNARYVELATKSGPEQAIQKLGEHLGLEAFQTQFLGFLSLCGIDGSSLDDNWWYGFLYNYCRVIQDCPLESEFQAGWHFDRVILIGPDFTVSGERLYIQWEFLLGQQQIGLWIGHRERSQPGGTILGPMLSFKKS
jgi:hypothetical protein